MPTTRSASTGFWRELDRGEAREVARVAGQRLEAFAVKLLIAETDQVGVARAVVDVEVGVFDLEVQRRGEQVFDLGLLDLEEVLVGLDLALLGRDNRGFEESGRRELLRIAGDDDAPGPGEHGQGFFQAALRRLVEDHDVEQVLAREDLGDGLRAGHPDGSQIEDRVATLDRLAVADHLAHAHGAMASGEQTALDLRSE